MLRWRAATALVLAPVALGAIALGKWAVLVVVLLVVAVAAYELSRALEPLPFVAALGAGALPVLLAIPYGPTGILAGALLARGKARDPHPQGGPRGALDGALGRRPAGPPRPLPALALRRHPRPHRRGGALGLRLRRLLRRALLRPSPALPEPQPEQDGRGRHRRSAVYDARRRRRLLPVPRLHPCQSGRYRGGGLHLLSVRGSLR